MRIDNAHINSRKERNKALAALAVAKKIEFESGRKPVFLKKGDSMEFTSSMRKITSEGVKELIERGKSTDDIAAYFRVSRNTVYYYKRKLKL